MAKAKISSEENLENVQTKKATSVTKTEKVEVEQGAQSGPSYEELLGLVQQLASEVKTLQQSGASGGTISTTEISQTDKILELLSKRKSDREVEIIHNCELIGGLTTHLELTGLTIDFRSVGEQRLLSWQQFEECVSKYRNFFEREIILLSDEESELATRYGIPCAKRGKNHTLTHEDITKLPKMNANQLEVFVNSLSEADQNVVYAYWLGKCYERENGFYDRYKVELLNRLSGRHAFDNLLAYMNGDYRDTSTEE